MQGAVSNVVDSRKEEGVSKKRITSVDLDSFEPPSAKRQNRFEDTKEEDTSVMAAILAIGKDFLNLADRVDARRHVSRRSSKIPYATVLRKL